MNTAAAEQVETTAHGHQAPRYDDVNVALIVLLGVVSAAITFVAIVFVQGLYYHWQATQIDEKVYGKPIFAAQEIARQKESLTGYLQTKDGKRSIPIDYAMKLVVEENRQEKKSNSHDDHAKHRGQEGEEHDAVSGNKTDKTGLSE